MNRGSMSNWPAAATVAASLDRVGLAALRMGLLVVGIGSGTAALFVALGRGAWPVVAEGLGIALVAFVGYWQAKLMARILRPRGTVLLIVALFAAWGALDDRVWSDYGEVAIALMVLAATVSSPAVVAGCVVISGVGFELGQLSAGHRLSWVFLGGGVGQLANQLAGLCLTGGTMLIAIWALRSTLSGSAASLAAARGGGGSLTPQLALAVARGPRALLNRADPRAVTQSLSRAERGVLDCLIRGLAPKQAARELGVEVATVRSHIAAAKRKTGARTVEQLVGLYVEAKLP
jgi:DNA-binding CsgD family transcriptional regulator